MATLPLSHFKPLWGALFFDDTFPASRRKTPHAKAWKRAHPFQRLFVALTSTWVKVLYLPMPPVPGRSFSA